MTGLWVVLVALGVALVFGGYRALTDGRARPVRAAAKADDTPRLHPAQVGESLGSSATFVQFSSSVCAPCRATHTLLAEVTGARPSVAHIDLNAETRLDLVKQFGITRTPTVLLLDRGGAVRHRIVGAARRAEVLEALESMA
ncbi:MAG: thioredoxin family protein [Micropruina sp.]|nr:thioredoxin family protein [Micropruina sp.]